MAAVEMERSGQMWVCLEMTWIGCGEGKEDENDLSNWVNDGVTY